MNMVYRAILNTADIRISADGNNDNEAIQRALNDSVTMRSADPKNVSVQVFNGGDLVYTTTLLKYTIDTE